MTTDEIIDKFMQSNSELVIANLRMRNALLRVLEWCESDDPNFEIDADEVRSAIGLK